MRWVALFSGQGGQRSEHAHQLRTCLPDDLRGAWQRALASAGVSTDALDADTLMRNRVAQPTVVAWQVAAFARLAAVLRSPVLVAGYSVGEVAACAAAGGIAPADAIELSVARAQAMDEAVDLPSGLAAVLGLAENDLARLCQDYGAAIAIRNGPRHFVVGGSQRSLDALIAAAPEAGVTRACLLPVEVPAHTHWLAPSVPRFAAALAGRVRGPLAVPMLSGIDASRLRSAEEAVSALSRQLATPLDWSACIEAIAEMQPDAVLEIGPGNALARMMVESAPDVRVRSLDEFRDPAAAIAWAARQAD